MCREYSSTSKTLRWFIWSCLQIWLVMKNTELWCAGHKDIRKQNHPFEFLASVWRSSYDNQLLTVWPELKGWMYQGAPADAPVPPVPFMLLFMHELTDDIFSHASVNMPHVSNFYTCCIGFSFIFWVEIGYWLCLCWDMFSTVATLMLTYIMVVI